MHSTYFVVNSRYSYVYVVINKAIEYEAYLDNDNLKVKAQGETKGIRPGERRF